MRYIVLLKGTQPAGPPPDGLMDGIMKLGAEATAAGALLDNAGLAPSAAGRPRPAHRRHAQRDGRPVRRGQGVHQLRALRGALQGGGVEWTSRFVRLHQDMWPGWEGEADVLKVFGPRTSRPRPDRRSRYGLGCPRRRDPTGDGAVDAAGRDRGARRAVEAVWRIEAGRLIAGARPDHPRRGRRRGAGPGRPGHRARTVASDRHPAQPGRLADGHREEPRDRRAPQARHAAAQGPDPRAGRRARAGAAAMLDDASTTTSATTCCGSMFTACHPVLSLESRVALTLRCLGGLTTQEIARAFLVPEATAAQRIVTGQAHADRAARRLRASRARADGRAARVGAGGGLPRVQRGLRRHRRRGLDAPGAVRGGDAARAGAGRRSRRPSPRSTACSR